MPEIVIQYEKPETLKILKAFAKYFDFRIQSSKTKSKTEISLNRVTILAASKDNAIATSEMQKIFGGKNVDAKELREKGMDEEFVICDTDVMIDYWDPENWHHDRTKDIVENQVGVKRIALSAITKMELMLGANNKSELSKITKNLEAYNIILINNDITANAFNLLGDYLLSHNLSLPDSIIAATAIVAELPLFTYNTRDFRYISNLNLYPHN